MSLVQHVQSATIFSAVAWCIKEEYKAKTIVYRLCKHMRLCICDSSPQLCFVDQNFEMHVCRKAK